MGFWSLLVIIETMSIAILYWAKTTAILYKTTVILYKTTVIKYCTKLLQYYTKKNAG